MLKGLSAKLRESLEKLARIGLVDKTAVDDLVKDIQRSLIASDVDVKLVFELSENIKKRAFEKLPPGLTRKEHVIKIETDQQVLKVVLGSEEVPDVNPEDNTWEKE